MMITLRGGDKVDSTNALGEKDPVKYHTSGRRQSFRGNDFFSPEKGHGGHSVVVCGFVAASTWAYESFER
jgi:hypothetical protein